MKTISLHCTMSVYRPFLLTLAILCGLTFHSIINAQEDWVIELRGGSIIYENNPTTQLFNRNPGGHESVRRGRSLGLNFSSFSSKKLFGINYGMLVGYSSFSHLYRLELNPPGYGITEYLSDVSTNQHFLKIGFLANRKFSKRSTNHWNICIRLTGTLSVYGTERTRTRMKTHLDPDYIHYNHIVSQSLTHMSNPRRTYPAGMSIDATLGYTINFGNYGINIFSGPEVFVLLDQTLVLANVGLGVVF